MKVVTARTVESHAQGGASCLSVPEGVAISPAAWDRARELGITLEVAKRAAGGRKTDARAPSGERRQRSPREAVPSEQGVAEVASAKDGDLIDRLCAAVGQRLSRPVDEAELRAALGTILKHFVSPS